MSRVTFVGGGVQDKTNKAANPARLVNCYVEGLKQGSRSTFTIRNALGTQAFASTGVALARDLEEVDGVLYAFVGGQLFEINEDGQATYLADMDDGEFVTISGNLDSVVVTSGGTYSVYKNGQVTKPMGGVFQATTSALFFDFLTVRTESGGARFDWSASADPTTLDGLNFATAEAHFDNLVRAMKLGRQLVLFGDTSTEIWTSTGTGSSAFTRRIHDFEIGLKGPKLATMAKDAIFFIGSDDVPYLMTGMTPMPLVHPGVERDIQNGILDRCGYFESGHHRHAYIRFKDRPAWVFDIATGEWWERATDGGAWEILKTVRCYGRWFGITNFGEIYELARTSSEVGGQMRREITALPAYFDGEFFTVSRLEVLGEFGAYDVGRDAKIMLEVSRDGGRTWEDPIEREVGTIGQYDAVAVWDSLGQFRQMTCRIAVTDPVDLALYSDGNVTIG